MEKYFLLYVNNNNQFFENIELKDVINFIKNEFNNENINVKIFLNSSENIKIKINSLEDKLTNIWKTEINHITIICDNAVFYHEGLYLYKKIKASMIKEGVIIMNISLETLNKCDV